MNDFLQLMPGFTSAVQKLHDLLALIVLVLMFAGLTIKIVQMQLQGGLRSLWPWLMRMAIVSFLVGGLVTWGNLLQSGVNDLISQLGLTQVNGNVYQAYRDAVAQRFGSDNAASNAVLQGVGGSNTASQTPFDITTEGDTSGGQVLQSASGLQLNHYGYESVGSPNYDSKSAQGIGAFPFDTAPHSLVPLQSAALSADVAARYNVQPGQQFTIATANGPMTLIYADKTADWVTGSVDVYDPNSALGNNQLIAINSFNDGPVMSNATGGNPTAMDWLSNPVGTLQKFVIDKLVWLLSLAALGVMWLMAGVQQIFYLIEIAISPIFLGCLLVPALISIGTRFLSSLIAICLWPLAWAVCDLVTRFLVNLAVNPTNNAGMQPFSIGAMLLGIWIVLAIWVIASSVLGPWIISKSLMGGSSAIAAVIAGSAGAAAVAPGLAYKAAALGAGAGGPAAAIGSNGAGAAASIASSTSMTPYQNFARRPMSSAQPTDRT